MGIVKDNMAVHEWPFPVYMEVLDEEGELCETQDLSSVSEAETFFEENYSHISGMQAGVYELSTVLRSSRTLVRSPEQSDTTLKDLKQQIKSLIAKADSAIAKIDTALKERR